MKRVTATAAVVASALATEGLPAIAAAGAVAVLVLAVLCWVIADTARARNTAELLRAVRGEGKPSISPVGPAGTIPAEPKAKHSGPRPETGPECSGHSPVVTSCP